MSLERLDAALAGEIEALQAEGRAKAPERVIVGYRPPEGDQGPRYRLRGVDRDFIRMNSNSYLSLSNHPMLIEAADRATHDFGVGPGAVRFIDGTFIHHVELEERIARFMGRPAARIFNSAYTANLGLALAISSKRTYWIGDELNHNSIIRAMRIAAVPRENKAIYRHNDVDDRRRCLQEVPEGIERVDEIARAVERYRDRWPEGLVTVVDDSHGIGAYGATGRGTEEFTGARADIVVGTFGKAFGVNGGFVAASETVVEAIRQKADTYIYTNPLSVADAAAAKAAVDLADGEEGRRRLQNLLDRTRQFREGISALGWESIPGPHPVVPLLVRDTARTRTLVQHFFDNGVLVVGLTYPVVPKGDETIRFQVNAAHTAADIGQVLGVLESFQG